MLLDWDKMCSCDENLTSTTRCEDKMVIYKEWRCNSESLEPWFVVPTGPLLQWLKHISFFVQSELHLRSEDNFHAFSIDSQYFHEGNEREVNVTALFKSTCLHSRKRDSFRLYQWWAGCPSWLTSYPGVQPRNHWAATRCLVVMARVLSLASLNTKGQSGCVEKNWPAELFQTTF